MLPPAIAGGSIVCLIGFILIGNGYLSDEEHGNYSILRSLGNCTDQNIYGLALVRFKICRNTGRIVSTRTLEGTIFSISFGEVIGI